MLADGLKLGFLRKGKCFWTGQDFFDMLPHIGVLLAEIDPDNLFSIGFATNSAFYLIMPVHHFRVYWS
jgi:hypothetical protein